MIDSSFEIHFSPLSRRTLFRNTAIAFLGSRVARVVCQTRETGSVRPKNTLTEASAISNLSQTCFPQNEKSDPHLSPHITDPPGMQAT